MENILNLSIEEMHNALKEGKFKPSDLVKASIEKAKENQETYNAFVTILEEALSVAYELDNSFEEDNPLYGIPYACKDNFSTKGILTTGSSNTLKNFVPVYDATVVTKLKDKKTVLIGKTVLDELAMGGTGTNGHTGICRNPWDKERLSGGSSGGSAVAVSLGIVPFAMGSDTGDSVRKPASLCGLVGFKPSWGRISRYGLFSFATSIDHVAFFTRTVKDSAYVLEAIAGGDYNDATSSFKEVENYSKNLNMDVKGLRIATIKELDELVHNEDLIKDYDKMLNGLRNAGATVDSISFDINLLRAILPVYLVLSCSEASSNNACLDGIKYGPRENGNSMVEEVFNTRSKNFSSSVKRRFVFGSYCLSKPNIDKVFVRAQKVRHLIVDKLHEILKEYDVILTPASGKVAPKFKDTTAEPMKDENLILENHMALGNLGGLPSLSLPICMSNNLPIAINVMGRPYEEQMVLNVSAAIENIFEFKNLIAKEGK